MLTEPVKVVSFAPIPSPSPQKGREHSSKPVILNKNMSSKTGNCHPELADFCTGETRVAKNVVSACEAIRTTVLSQKKPKTVSGSVFYIGKKFAGWHYYANILCFAGFILPD